MVKLTRHWFLLKKPLFSLINLLRQQWRMFNLRKER